MPFAAKIITSFIVLTSATTLFSGCKTGTAGSNLQSEKSPQAISKINPSRDDALDLFKIIGDAGVKPFKVGSFAEQYNLTSISCDSTFIGNATGFSCTIINARDASHPVQSNGDAAKALFTKLHILGVPATAQGVESGLVATGKVSCSRSLSNDPSDDNCQITLAAKAQPKPKVTKTLVPGRDDSLKLFQALSAAGVKPFQVGTFAEQFNLTSIKCDVTQIVNATAYTCSVINARDAAHPVNSNGVAAKDLFTLLQKAGVPLSAQGVEGSGFMTGNVSCSRSLVNDPSDDNCSIKVVESND